MQKGFTPLIILIGIVVIIGIVGGAYYLGTIKNSSQSQVATSLTTPSPSIQPIQTTLSPTSTVDETANWKIYTNSTYGFSFKYPSTWSIEEKYPNSISFINPEKDFALTVSYKKAGDTTRIVRTGVGAGDLVTRGTVKFNDVTLTRDVLVYQNVNKSVLYNEAGEVKSGNLVFAISLDRNVSLNEGILTQSIEQEADKILSTFKFTQ